MQQPEESRQRAEESAANAAALCATVAERERERKRKREREECSDYKQLSRRRAKLWQRLRRVENFVTANPAGLVWRATQCDADTAAVIVTVKRKVLKVMPSQ